MGRLFYIINTMDNDATTAQMAKASAAMVLTYFFGRNSSLTIRSFFYFCLLTVHARAFCEQVISPLYKIVQGNFCYLLRARWVDVFSLSTVSVGDNFLFCVCWSLGLTSTYIISYSETFIPIMITSSNGNIFRVTGHLCGIHRSPAKSPHKGQ